MHASFGESRLQETFFGVVTALVHVLGSVASVFLFVVNYRGSIGFGQDNIFSLPGRVGDQDVKDVQVKQTCE